MDADSKYLNTFTIIKFMIIAWHRSSKIKGCCFLFMLLFVVSNTFSQKPASSEVDRWKKQSKQVTIIRDNWGIPHVYGKTDADAVFGLLYAQCEDDFNRVEMNYIEKLGRRAEVKGRSEIYNDLLIRIIIDSSDAIKDYKQSPPWLKKLMDAF